ncbi:unnamed protein product [Brassica napus]|uniref:(rape) hypothetical protein n=1 Tax=Brassica napus TaxID=3708 RepID=A0A816US68_BRANA|nr:unnamed protein product [Brassica napus]
MILLAHGFRPNTLFSKVRVNGQNAAPLYKFLKASKPTFLGSRIKWNFTKFLVSKDGIVIDRYGTMVYTSVHRYAFFTVAGRDPDCSRLD